jgi:TolB-like protein
MSMRDIPHSEPLPAGDMKNLPGREPPFRKQAIPGPASLIILTLLTALLLVCPGCGSKQQKFMRDGSEYGATDGGFTGTWLDYYERGRTFAKGGFHSEAFTNLRQAIEENGKDQWDAVDTDGNLIDYFPHRELGILHYQRREYDKAIAELEYSIESAPSARAGYFLDKARAARIDRYGLDQASPELNLATTTAESITTGLTKVVRGVADDDTYVAGITIGNRRADMKPAARKKIFSTEVPLDPGENRIRIVATDLAGKSTEQYLTVYSDRQGPFIEIEELSLNNGRVHLQGNISDDKGLASLSINNVRWPITGRAAGYTFKLTLPDENITIIAADLAGNITRAVVREHETCSQEEVIPLPAEATISDPANAEELSASDHPPQPPLPQVPVGVDVEPPYIRIRTPGPDDKTFAETMLLEGMVSDASLLVYISINGEPVSNRKGRKVFFSQLHTLAPGNNTFRVAAADEMGNKAYKTIQVQRQVPAVRRMEARMTVAVLPFARPGATTGPIPVRDLITDSFISLDRFRVMEKSETDAAIHEQAWNSIPPLNHDSAALIGKKVGAQAVLTGTVLDYPGSVEIIGRLIDVETGMILARNDVFGETGGTEESPVNLVDELALLFRQDLPLAEGSLLHVRGNQVIIDAGADKKIRPAMQFICYREAPPARHPVTGQAIVSEPRILAILKVEKVDENSCRASILESYADLMVSDRVIAR